MKTGKVWGTTELLLKTGLIEIHRLSIFPQAHCSMHHHRFKWNAFLVLEGELHIDVEKDAYGLKDRTTLYPGELMTVQPGENHQFCSGTEPCVAIEIYYPEMLSEDIVRRSVGGVVDARASRVAKRRRKKGR
jgi:mannose-6-phosphate isomerase-like protein (cupin superfamily)